MCSIESVLNKAIGYQTMISKIETYGSECAEKIHKYITDRGGKCAVLGWSVVSDYSFSEEESLSLLPYISTITDQLSVTDLQHFANCDL